MSTFWGTFIGAFAGVLAGLLIGILQKWLSGRKDKKAKLNRLKSDLEWNIERITDLAQNVADMKSKTKEDGAFNPQEIYKHLELSKVLSVP